MQIYSSHLRYLPLPISHPTPSKTVLQAHTPSRQPSTPVQHPMHEDKSPAPLHTISSAPALPQLSPFSSPAHEKSPAGTKPTGLSMLKTKICLFALICGGDGENRTPVRKRCHTDFSERSLCLSFRYGQTQTTAVHPILEKFPIQPSRSQASGIPQLAPYSLRRLLSEQGLALSYYSVVFVCFFI